MKKLGILAFVVILILSVSVVPAFSQDDDTIVIGFLPGVVDPFYQLMEIGVNQAIADSGLNIELVVQIPESFAPVTQTPLLDAMVARGDIDYLIVAATDKEQMVAPLELAHDAGIEIISVDTFIGDGDYVNGPITFPLSYIGSDNTEGGRIAARALAANVGEEGKVYVQNVNPGISTTDQREQGFREGIAEYPNMEIVGVDYNEDNENLSVQQTSAVLERESELVGVFGTNVFSANGAGIAVGNAGLSGAIDVIAFDATSFAAEQMRAGVVSMMIAQKPFDMGYMAVQMALAHNAGVSSIPKRIPTGYAVITMDNIDDPAVARFIYEVGE